LTVFRASQELLLTLHYLSCCVWIFANIVVIIL